MCDNVLQPDPRSLANVNIPKRMLYRHCYIPSLQAQAVQKYKIKPGFSIAISRPTGVNWQSKTLVAISDPRLSIVKSVFDCRLSNVETESFFDRNMKNVNYS